MSQNDAAAFDAAQRRYEQETDNMIDERYIDDVAVCVDCNIECKHARLQTVSSLYCKKLHCTVNFENGWEGK